MSHEGKVVWRECSSTDIAKSLAFYKGLFGWKLTEVPMGDFVYTMAQVGEKQVGGLMPMPKEAAGVPSNWMSYVLRCSKQRSESANSSKNCRRPRPLQATWERLLSGMRLCELNLSKLRTSSKSWKSCELRCSRPKSVLPNWNKS